MKTVLEVVAGSTAHGTSVTDGLEDLDLMRVVLEDKYNFVGFKAKDTWVQRTKPEGVRSEAGDTDLVVYGLRKYLGLALKGNPSALMPLFAGQDHIREISAEGHELRQLAPAIVSKKAYMPFKGYMKQQYERLLGVRGQKRVTRPELVERHGYDTKYAGHIIRLGMQGEELLLTGVMTLPMKQPDRDEIVKVRLGHYQLNDVCNMVEAYDKRLTEAYEKSPLQEEPRYDTVNQWMVDTYIREWTSDS